MKITVQHEGKTYTHTFGEPAPSRTRRVASAAVRTVARPARGIKSAVLSAKSRLGAALRAIKASPGSQVEIIVLGAAPAADQSLA